MESQRTHSQLHEGGPCRQFGFCKRTCFSRAILCCKLGTCDQSCCKKEDRKPATFKRSIYCVLAAAVVFYSAVSVLLVLLRRIDPPSTAVQIERRLAHWFSACRTKSDILSYLSSVFRRKFSTPSWRPRTHASSIITVSIGKRLGMRSAKIGG